MIVVFGTACIDRLRTVPFMPKAGGYVEILEERDSLGGEAANTAVTLAAWGDPATLACNPLGQDADADRLRKFLSEKHVPFTELSTTEVASTTLATPVCEIFVTPNGERTMFGRGFSSLDAHTDLGNLVLPPGSLFTAEPNMEITSRSAVRLAQAAGSVCYLMDFIREDDPIAPGSFWQSSTDWVGTRNDSIGNMRWVQSFVERTGAIAILSDGPRGFVAGSPELPALAYPPFIAPSVVDTTGAGDMFRAGMLHGLSLGWPIADCLRFASAAGCLKCQYQGATSRVPTSDEILQLIADYPAVARQYDQAS